MSTADHTMLMVLGVAVGIATGSFSIIARYLFDRGLAYRNMLAPTITDRHRTKITHTRKKPGRMGVAVRVRRVSAVMFISIGVFHTIGRLILPRTFWLQPLSETLDNKSNGALHDCSHHTNKISAGHRAGP